MSDDPNLYLVGRLCRYCGKSTDNVLYGLCSAKCMIALYHKNKAKA